VAKIQSIEEAKRKADSSYRNRLRISLVTARNAPSHERALNTLKSWGVMPNDAFFLGGIDKMKVLGVMKPHIFFDDQSGHLAGAATVAPSVHIPFGIKNSASSK
jgi:5'-nucleotidase